MGDLIAALVHAGDAVVPAQGIFVEAGPEVAEAEWDGGEDGGEDAAAHGGAGGVVVGEGAEADAGVAHAGGALGEGEEEGLVEQGEEEEDSCCSDDGDLRGQVMDEWAGLGELVDGHG